MKHGRGRLYRKRYGWLLPGYIGRMWDGENFCHFSMRIRARSDGRGDVFPLRDAVVTYSLCVMAKDEDDAEQVKWLCKQRKGNKKSKDGKRK